MGRRQYAASGLAAVAFFAGLRTLDAQAVVVARPRPGIGVGVHVGAYVGTAGFGGGHLHHRRVLLAPGVAAPLGVAPAFAPQTAGASSITGVLEALRLIDLIGSRLPSGGSGGNGGARIDALNTRLQSIEGKLDTILTTVENSASQAELTATRKLVEQHDAVLKKLYQAYETAAPVSKEEIKKICREVNAEIASGFSTKLDEMKGGMNARFADMDAKFTGIDSKIAEVLKAVRPTGQGGNADKPVNNADKPVNNADKPVNNADKPANNADAPKPPPSPKPASPGGAGS